MPEEEVKKRAPRAKRATTEKAYISISWKIEAEGTEAALKIHDENIAKMSSIIKKFEAISSEAEFQNSVSFDNSYTGKITDPKITCHSYTYVTFDVAKNASLNQLIIDLDTLNYSSLNYDITKK